MFLLKEKINNITEEIINISVNNYCLTVTPPPPAK